MSDFVNDNIDALINSLEKTGHKIRQTLMP